jgi:hypothetical protein
MNAPTVRLVVPSICQKTEVKQIGFLTSHGSVTAVTLGLIKGPYAAAGILT